MVDERNPFMSQDQKTLADVLELITQDKTLPDQRRRNLCSALRALGKVMGKDLRYLPADPGFYRDAMKRLHPEHCGYSRSRIRNIKSDVLFALKHVGHIQGARTYMAPFSPDWQFVWEQAAAAGRKRVYVSRLMHFCSANGIGPDAVNDNVSEQLRTALVEESFVADPVGTWKGILRTWNTLVNEVPEFPKVPLSIPNDRDDYSTPIEHFPQSLQDEISALVDHWSGSDLLADDGLDKPLKPRTIQSRLYRLRQAVSALVLTGMDKTQISSLAVITELENAKTILRFYLERAGNQPTSQIHGIAILIKTLARHWVKVDEDQYKALKGLVAKVDPQIKGMTAKNKDRLRPLDDPKNVDLLLSFPERRIREVIAQDRGLRSDAVQVQLALAVELLLMAPVRAANLVGLSLDKHIHRTRAGHDGVVHLVIPGSEVKNQVDLEFELHKETVTHLDLYLERFHPRLTDRPSPWLFPGGSSSSHKTVNTLGEQIKDAVFKGTGLAVNLHLFRHIAGKLYLDDNPGGYEKVRQLLGHRDINTTIKFYAGMEIRAVTRHYDETILKLRSKVKRGR